MVTTDSGVVLFDIPRDSERDFTAHNEESRALWDAFASRTHDRIPVRLNCHPRMLMLDPQYNRRGITYEEYMSDPDLMGQVILEFQYWRRFFLPGDHERGLPDHWEIYIDFQNHYDAAWFGCPVHYRAGEVPDTSPILDDDNKKMLFDRGIPDPFAGEWAVRCLRFMEAFEKRSAQGWTFLGRPVHAPKAAPFMNCDGVFTAAASLRSPQALCMDLLADPDYARQLLEYVWSSASARMRAWRDRFDQPVSQDGYVGADDSIELISTDLYREFVLPLHRRLYDEFGTGVDRGIHLCGDAQRHFKTIRDELGVSAFDTGFPIDFARFRTELGPDVLISGGPPVSFFIRDDPEGIVEEVTRILRSGVLEGGRFILQEANNLAPQARLHMCEAFYEAGKALGRLSR